MAYENHVCVYQWTLLRLRQRRISTMSFEVINIYRHERVAVITLNRPVVLNALSLQLVTELSLIHI